MSFTVSLMKLLSLTADVMNLKMDQYTGISVHFYFSYGYIIFLHEQIRTPRRRFHSTDSQAQACLQMFGFYIRRSSSLLSSHTCEHTRLHAYMELWCRPGPFCAVSVQNMAAECSAAQLKGVYFIECLFRSVKHATQGPCGAMHSNSFLPHSSQPLPV